MAKSRLKVLQDRQAAIVQQMQGMTEKLTAEDRSAFDAEEDKIFQALKVEAEDVKRGLKIENDIQETLKSMPAVQTGDTDPVGTSEKLAAEKQKKTQAIIPIQQLSSARMRFWHPLPGENREQMLHRAYGAGRWLLSVCSPDEEVRAKNRLWCREQGVQSLAQTESVNSAGGVLVPEVLSDQIIILREQYGVFRRFAKVYPMESDNLTVPRRTSGLTAYYVSDSISATESQMGWDGVTLVAKELAALVRYPNTLSDDAVINIADTLSGEIAYAFALAEDNAGFIGDGTLTYGGISGLTVIIDDANHGNAVTTNGTTNGGKQVAAAGGTGISTVVLSDFEKCVGLLPQYASMNACWFMSRAIYASGPQRLMDAGGGNTNETLAVGSMGNLNAQDPFGRPYRTFLGYPVIITQVMNSVLGTQTSKIVALLGDLSMSSSLGQRKEIRIDASPHRYFEFRQVGLLGVQRFDIVNHDLGNTTTAGPVVALETSAS